MTVDFMNRMWRGLLARVRPTRRYASPGQVEVAELRFYERFLKPGQVVFDVGANIGRMTELFATAVGSEGKVFAFEPAQASFLELTERCADLPSQCELVNAAVTESEGSIQLHVYDHDHRSWSSMAHRPLENYGIHIAPPRIETVQTVSIDRYCSAHGINQIDLMKIDVEGAELLVLRGARQMLKEKRISLVLFEFGQTTFDMGVSPLDLQLLLDDVGYSFRNVIEGEPSFPGGNSAETAAYSMHVAAPKG